LYAAPSDNRANGENRIVPWCTFRDLCISGFSQQEHQHRPTIASRPTELTLKYGQECCGFEVHMTSIPDLSDPRYLDEVGWFLYHEKYGREQFGGSYDDERLAYSRLLRDEVLGYCGQEERWLKDKTVVTIGCGCTGDLVAWPAAAKIAVDPLLYTYQQLGMLVDDIVGGPTMYLAVGIEELPLLDACADLVICRNSLDHMMDPRLGLKKVSGILKDGAHLFVSVDLGGVPTPDEPNVFSVESLATLLEERFAIIRQTDNHAPHSIGRTGSMRILARKKPSGRQELNRDSVLKAYMARVEENA
jgi:SAM-dependent methyltransferase